MADESPPPKKIGSLRDRIAAFEKQSSNSPSNPPPTRPKPSGNVSWKPKQTSPPPSPSNKDKERTTPVKSSMSAADAKESIGQGVSLKERMAALQGKGGFGPTNPPPKPMTEKPKWKPPPKPVNPSSPSEEKAPVDFEAVVRSPPLETEPTETQTEKPTESAEQEDEGGENKEDPEEEERQRRAAIAARMQRLGGARIGMAPPVIAPKPPTRRASVPKEAETKPEVISPPAVAEDQSEESGEIQPKDSNDSVDKPVGTVSTSHKPPTSMPVPSAPRRAAPPRRKKETPKPSDEPPTEEEAVVPEAQIPLPESTSNLLADVEGEKTDVPSDVDLKPIPTTELAKEGSPEPAEDPTLVTERSTSPTLVKPGDHDDVPEDTRAPSPPEEDPPVTLSEEKVAEIVEEGQKEIEVRSGIDQPEQDLEEPPAEMSKDEEPANLGRPADGGSEHEVLTAEPDVTEDKPEEQPEEEEDEATKRARIAARLAKSGGFNPFAGGPPARKPSSGSVSGRRTSLEPPARKPSYGSIAEKRTSLEPPTRKSSDGSIPERRTSLGIPDRFKPTVDEEQEPPAQPLARMDAVSLHGEIGFPTTESKEEGGPFDTLKRVEDNGWNPDESKEVDDETVPGDRLDVEYTNTSSLPPFTVPPPPPLTFRPVPLVRPAPDSEILTKLPARRSLPQPPSPASLPTRSSEEGSDSRKELSLPPRLPPGRASAVIPPPPAAPRPIPSRPNAETQESHDIVSREGEEYDEAPSTTSFDFPQYTDITSHPQAVAIQQDPPEKEILADEDGDPIDPGFIPSRSPSIKAAKSPAEPPRPPREELVPESAPDEDQEQVRKRRLAERMAKLGGIRFGAPPPIGISPPPKAERETEGEGEEKIKEDEEDEEDEQARRQRIAAKLAGMGGMRIGMVPGVIPPQKPPTPIRKDSASVRRPEQKYPPPPPIRAPPPIQAPPPPVRSDTGNVSEDDVVKVEMEESDAEEVDYHDVGEEVPPPIPSRTARPPIPHPGSLRKGSTDSIPFPTENSTPSRAVLPAPSEYVMVEEPEVDQESTPPPPPRRPPRAAPPPPAPSSDDVPDDMTMSQWELPPIPSSSLEMEASGADLSASSWSEPFDNEETSQEKTPEASSITRRQSASERRQSLGQMTADQLMTIWGRVGIQVCEVAIQLFEKSKKTLIGDGTHIGFVNAVLDEVPNATTVEEGTSSFGYPIYVQTGSSVTKRAADIMPGDIIVLQDAKLKGHKGPIHAYQQTVGAGSPVVAVVGEYEPKKSKVKAYQANQHVGSQTVESVSYRLEDLKSGSVKVFRVLEA